MFRSVSEPLISDSDRITCRSDRVRIVLIRPSHPGNIGAAARAMLTMGLRHLYLVQPDIFPSDVAVARAAGADHLLEQAVICPDLDSALRGTHLVLATSARRRSISWPLQLPASAMQTAWQATEQGQVAILFGRENSGLSNAELDRASIHVMIPVNAAFHSLNLASAVQIMTYELRQAMTDKSFLAARPVDKRNQAAMSEDVERFFNHLERVLERIDFIKSPYSSILLRKIRRLFVRAVMSVDDVNIFRGILSAIEYQLRHKGK